jgi:hypothetical protein
MVAMEMCLQFWLSADMSQYGDGKDKNCNFHQFYVRIVICRDSMTEQKLVNPPCCYLLQEAETHEVVATSTAIMFIPYFE